MNIIESKKKIDDMIENVDKFRFSDSKEALRIALETLDMSKEANYPQAEAILLYKIGNIYSNISEYSKAIEYIVAAVSMLELYNLNYYFCSSYITLGNIFYNLSYFETAFDYYNKSIYVANQFQYADRLSSAYNNIGEIYKILLDYDKAIEYYEKSISEDGKMDFKDCKGITFINLAEINYYNGNYSKALELLPVGHSYMKKNNYEILLCEVYKVYALICWKLKEIDKARDNFSKAINIAEKKLAYNYKIDILIYYHQFLEEQNQIDSAILALSEAYSLALSNNLHEKSKKICRYYTEIFEKIDDYKSVLKYHKLYISHDQEQLKEKLNQIKEGIDLRIKTEEIKLQSEIDSLTGIPNRRKLLQFFRTQWEQALVCHYDISLIIIDIDYFKQYNDNFGHPEGDKCLIEISKTLYNELDKKYFLCRYGGDEFIVVLPQTTLAEAVDVAEDLRKAVSDMRIFHNYSSKFNSVTITLGVSSVIPGDETSYDDLIKQADDALYEAKRKGRNNVISFLK